MTVIKTQIPEARKAKRRRAVGEAQAHPDRGPQSETAEAVTSLDEEVKAVRALMIVVDDPS